MTFLDPQQSGFKTSWALLIIIVLSAGRAGWWAKDKIDQIAGNSSSAAAGVADLKTQLQRSEQAAAARADRIRALEVWRAGTDEAIAGLHASVSDLRGRIEAISH